ncbi:MAG: Mu-like prophage major head subunit gpT family protein [Methylobacter sp.]
MLINGTNIASLFQGFNTSFNKGQQGAPSRYKEVAMVVPSTTSETTYGWLGEFPGLREWLGDRVIKNLESHGYTIKNKLFESSVKVKRTDIEDDQYGIYGPLMEEMGRAAGVHPDELIFALLELGFSTLCYDGQNFFDTDHPVGGEEGVTNVSNMQAGAGAAWFLLDTSRAIKPLLFQERIPYSFQSLTAETDENVFKRDEYLYGVRGRANAGFGLWQLAFGSKATLDVTNYAAARSAMMSIKTSEGRPMGIVPTKLVVGPSLEQAGRKLVNNQLVDDGGVAVSNEWAGSVELVVVPWLT